MTQFSFDPFVIDDNANNNVSGRGGTIASSGRVASRTSRKNPGTTTTTTTGSTLHSTTNSISTNTTSKLPARLNVSLILHEEVSSTASMNSNSESSTTSKLDIEGKVVARIESSNANDNTPFCLRISGSMLSLANIKYSDHAILLDDDGRTHDNSTTEAKDLRCKVHIPKSELAGCEILSYNLNARTQNMPMLVQSKMAVKSTTCRMSIQIRSNLSNKGDISNLTIIVAIPNTLRGETVLVTRGKQGVWDATKRIVAWKIGTLPHGESCLVSAEAEVSSTVANLMHEPQHDATKVIKEKVRCPVLVRCSSEVDQVSDLRLSAIALPDVPANIARVNQVTSYRILHRV